MEKTNWKLVEKQVRGMSVKSKQSLNNIFLNKCSIVFYNQALDKKNPESNEITKMGYQNATGALISKSTLQYSYLNSLSQTFTLLRSHII